MPSGLAEEVQSESGDPSTSDDVNRSTSSSTPRTTAAPAAEGAGTIDAPQAARKKMQISTPGDEDDEGSWGIEEEYAGPAWVPWISMGSQQVGYGLDFHRR